MSSPRKADPMEFQYRNKSLPHSGWGGLILYFGDLRCPFKTAGFEDALFVV